MSGRPENTLRWRGSYERKQLNMVSCECGCGRMFYKRSPVHVLADPCAYARQREHSRRAYRQKKAKTAAL